MFRGIYRILIYTQLLTEQDNRPVSQLFKNNVCVLIHQSRRCLLSKMNIKLTLIGILHSASNDFDLKHVTAYRIQYYTVSFDSSDHVRFEGFHWVSLKCGSRFATLNMGIFLHVPAIFCFKVLSILLSFVVSEIIIRYYHA